MIIQTFCRLTNHSVDFFLVVSATQPPPEFSSIFLLKLKCCRQHRAAGFPSAGRSSWCVIWRLGGQAPPPDDSLCGCSIAFCFEFLLFRKIFVLFSTATPPSHSAPPPHRPPSRSGKALISSSDMERLMQSSVIKNEWTQSVISSSIITATSSSASSV